MSRYCIMYPSDRFGFDFGALGEDDRKLVAEPRYVSLIEILEDSTAREVAHLIPIDFATRVVKALNLYEQHQDH